MWYYIHRQNIHWLIFIHNTVDDYISLFHKIVLRFLQWIIGYDKIRENKSNFSNNVWKKNQEIETLAKIWTHHIMIILDNS